MKKSMIPFLFLASVVFTAGCVQVGFEGLQAYIGVGGPEYTATEKLSVSGRSALDEVRGGRPTSFLFDLKNKGNTTVKNVSIEITDSCVFDGSAPSSTEVDDLEPGEPFSWDVKMKSSDVNITRNCDIRYRVSYASKAHALYDILAMSEEEYLRLKKRGEFKNRTKLNYYKTNTPVEVEISLSHEQPVHGGDEFYLTLKFVNQGEGKVKGQELRKDKVTLKYPSFLTWNDNWCQGVMQEKSEPTDGKKGVLTLKGPLTFIEKETTPITCKFKVPKGEIKIMEQEKVEVGVKYKYVVDKKLSVKVIPS